MRQLRLLATVTAGLLVIGTAWAERPPREARSDNGQFVVRIDPGRGGRECRATLYKQSDDNRRGRRVWERTLVNDVAPTHVFVRDDGQFVVTLDEFRRGGARHALVIYGGQGELLRHFLLSDLLDKADWPHVRVRQREVEWLKEVRAAFADQRQQFVIELKWGHTLRIDLRTLQVIRDNGSDQQVLATIPAEVLAAMLGDLGTETEGAIAGRLAELAALSPEEQSQADQIAEQLTAVSTLPEADVTEALVPPEEETAEDAERRLAREDEDKSAPELAADEEAYDVPTDERESVGALLTGIEIPPPSVGEKYDYVGWLNETGRVDGPDANPVYEAAYAQLAEWDGDSDLLRAAERGEPDALVSPEVAAFLDANAQALDLFREASNYSTKGWEYDSEDGSMMGVLLPSMAPFRALAKASVLDGRRLALTGRPAEAAERYLDVMAAGRHVGEGLTLIENLVGTATQNRAADALLDLMADPDADNIDFVDLAAEAEAAYQPPRSSAEAIQAERAFYMDSVQRLWDEAETGDRTLNRAKARELLSYTSESSDSAVEAMIDELAAASFEDAVAAGNAHYDALAEAVSVDYAEASRRLAEIEDRMQAENNPYLNHLTPSLSRYHLVKTKAEANRRATLLVTNLRAYRQAYGSYPPSLEAFGDLDFSIDPLSGTHFVYRRDGDDFVLYSVGGHGADDAGAGDRGGQTRDLRYWPRPRPE